MQVDIQCDQGTSTTSPNPLFTVDFGRGIQQTNPLSVSMPAGRCNAHPE